MINQRETGQWWLDGAAGIGSSSSAMSYATINGQRIHFEDSGGSGPPVILAHGFLMDQSMFDRQVEVLAPAFRVIRWDERGFGQTEEDGRPFTYWDSAADCI